MKIRVLQLLITAMLFTSMEGVAESVDDEVFHQTHHSHVDRLDQWYPDSDGDEHDGDSCEHFCHVHVIGLISHKSVPQLSPSHGYLVARSIENHERATAPPTPPPNA
jgi:hypothetical protein